MGLLFPNIWKKLNKKNHVPNHQAVFVWSKLSTGRMGGFSWLRFRNPPN
jgi:hypothetical protein